MKNQSTKIKKIIIVLLFCILLILTLKIIYSRNDSYEQLDDIEIMEGSLSFDLNKVKKIESRSDYCLVKKCIEKFYKYYIDNEDIYSLLDDEYIQLFNIEKDNLKGKFGSFEKVIVDITRNVLFRNWIRDKCLFCLWISYRRRLK